MRRAQSVRHYARPSLALAADDLGVLREGDESNEDILRRQLLEKDQECDRLQMTIQALQEQLSLRPPIEKHQALEKDNKNLEILLQGANRENQKTMADIERSRAREKMLERELNRLAGDNWQANLEIPPSTLSLRSSSGVSTGLNMMHHRSNTIASPMSYNVTRHHSPSPSPRPDSSSGSRSSARTSSSPTPYDHPSRAQQPQDQEHREAQRQAALAQIEQVRLLILGIDQKLDMREEKLTKMVERAEGEGRRYESKAAEAQAAGVMH
ncbi:hypothetical protein GALMADRAFT_85214 [Galerina marginata CBS 339.88]|uniref:Uncharacterized protein n=1 Tax=Galerina marginata (strain CBS 339.88) TaxID=685588 RepID=A0A067TS70_GALM3|nr:hypothetical protein GALMADRAFT_85214 [Galerina marginata CBS 339.88]